jgi:hypothetical protein
VVTNVIKTILQQMVPNGLITRDLQTTTAVWNNPSRLVCIPQPKATRAGVLMQTATAIAADAGG